MSICILLQSLYGVYTPGASATETAAFRLVRGTETDSSSQVVNYA